MPTNKLLKELDVYFLIQTLAFSLRADFKVSDKLVTANKNSTNPAVIERNISVI
jgi:hypothetical protein